MRYKCKTLPINKLLMTHRGFIDCLCSSCKTLDCSNYIEKRKISILGVKKEIKVYARGDEVSFVMECEGYTI